MAKREEYLKTRISDLDLEEVYDLFRNTKGCALRDVKRIDKIDERFYRIVSDRTRTNGVIYDRENKTALADYEYRMLSRRGELMEAEVVNALKKLGISLRKFLEATITENGLFEISTTVGTIEVNRETGTICRKVGNRVNSTAPYRNRHMGDGSYTIHTKSGAAVLHPRYTAKKA